MAYVYLTIHGEAQNGFVSMYHGWHPASILDGLKECIGQNGWGFHRVLGVQAWADDEEGNLSDLTQEEIDQMLT